MEYHVIANSLFDDSEFAYGEHREASYKTGEAKKCQSCGAFLSMLEWLPPFEVNVSKKELGDFIYGSYVGFIVSKNFKDKFEQTGLKGLTNFRKVDLYHKRKLLSEEYYYPEISLISAFVDLKYIEFDEKDLCDTCQKGKSIISKIDGIVFETPDKINEDIFFTTSIGQSTIVLSDNFRDYLEKEGFTNLKLLDAAKFKWDSLNPIEY